jgi:hypothetical protein
VLCTGRVPRLGLSAARAALVVAAVVVVVVLFVNPKHVQFNVLLLLMRFLFKCVNIY